MPWQPNKKRPASDVGCRAFSCIPPTEAVARAYLTTLNYVRARSRSEELEQVQFFTHLITTLNYVRARSRSEELEQVQLFTHLITTLNYVRARSRSEELEQVQFFTHLITTFLPLMM